MHPVLRNILALLAGIIAGSLINGALISISAHIIPPPAGVDVTTEAGLKAGIHLFEPRHFIFPFLAHALGTFFGAWITVLIAANRKMMWAMIVSLLFFIGGAMMVYSLPAPMWFNITDLVLAYFPMGYLAARLGMRRRP
ncbi:MAG: hypothetical protein ABS68_14330 [Niastella sp. SCN 39-18]|nr:MAG: hypothetical protein ABS68_14330 [Niastella sp. SCN 39-18]OJV56384.1 MAG: hypothetical protein BGO31_14955 [Bacteroidetes bacterium 43-16]